jgi:para-nitrobenzyl esterase
MLYIHGGGFTGGSGAIASFDGSALARKGVIVVTINYRLGIFGFLAHPELTRESPHRSSGNYGLADQAAAMKWVHDNIAAFGGDPMRVTIFGQSAGSISVLDHMVSPVSRGLFQGVIAESGTPMLARGNTSLAEAESQGTAFVAKQSMTISQLRAIPADELMKRWTEARGAAWPIVDGWILPRAPSEVFAAGGEARVPLMTGSNAREGFSAVTDANLPDAVRAAYGDAAPRALQIYKPSATPDPVLGTAANTFATDTMFRCPAVVLQGWHAKQGSPVYAYHFENTLPGREALGSQHSDEVSYVFGTLDMIAHYTTGKPTPPPAAQLSEQVMTYWTNFAKAGNPNGPGVPLWPRFTNKGGAFQHLNSSGVHSGTNLRHDACALYRDAAMERLMTRSLF